MSFLREYTNGQKSSMRLNMLLATGASVILLLSVAAYIIIHAVKGNFGLDWTGMGVFCLGIAGVLTGVSYTKALQKKAENGNAKQD